MQTRWLHFGGLTLQTEGKGRVTCTPIAIGDWWMKLKNIPLLTPDAHSRPVHQQRSIVFRCHFGHPAYGMPDTPIVRHTVAGSKLLIINRYSNPEDYGWYSSRSVICRHSLCSLTLEIQDTLRWVTRVWISVATMYWSGICGGLQKIFLREFPFLLYKCSIPLEFPFLLLYKCSIPLEFPFLLYKCSIPLELPFLLYKCSTPLELPFLL